MLGQYKKIIIAVIVILVIMIAYKTLNNPTSPIDNLIRTPSVGTQTAENTLGRDLVEKLNRVKGITLDRSIFSDRVYLYLVSRASNNLSDKIEEQPVGNRGDIFSPSSSDVSVSE
jgi:hypothetical protein